MNLLQTLDMLLGIDNIEVTVLEYNTKTDAENLASDWQNVGDYIRKSMEKLDKELKNEKNR